MIPNITGKTKLVGIIGWPVEHSLSPAMHNAAFAALGLNYCYVPLPVEPTRLPEAMGGLRALGFVGANVTIPHKERVMPYLDEVSPEAKAIGAVNTIVVRDERLAGHNTDVAGFLRALREGGFAPEGKRAVVLGAGGAARAVVYALASVGAEVAVLNRTPERARVLIADLSAHFPSPSLTALPLEASTLVRQLTGADLLVNATSVGMSPRTDQSPLPDDRLIPAHLTVFDLVYNPLQTRLLQQAGAAGAKTIGGLGMLVHQGAEAFKLWTGIEAPIEVMYRAASERLEV